MIPADFGKGVIRVEVHGVEGLGESRREKAVREAGRVRPEGGGYVMRGGDVCHLLFNR